MKRARDDSAAGASGGDSAAGAQPALPPSTREDALRAVSAAQARVAEQAAVLQGLRATSQHALEDLARMDQASAAAAAATAAAAVAAAMAAASAAAAAAEAAAAAAAATAAASAPADVPPAEAAGGSSSDSSSSGSSLSGGGGSGGSSSSSSSAACNCGALRKFTKCVSETLWFGEWLSVGLCQHGRIFACGQGVRCASPPHPSTYSRVALSSTEPVLDVLVGCKAGYNDAGFYAATSTHILQIEDVSKPEKVLFSCASGDSIAAKVWSMSSGAVSVIVLTAQRKIYSGGGGKSSFLDKRDPTVPGERCDYHTFVDPRCDQKLLLNCSALCALPFDETLTGLREQQEGVLSGSLQLPYFTTRSKTGEEGFIYLRAPPGNWHGPTLCWEFGRVHKPARG